MWLIGHRCKCSNVLSWVILIGRGLDQEKDGIKEFKQRSEIGKETNIVLSNSVAIAQRTHPYPYRTRKLSSVALMILGWWRPGKVGRCRGREKPVEEIQQVFCCLNQTIKLNCNFWVLRLSVRYFIYITANNKNTEKQSFAGGCVTLFFCVLRIL